MISQYRIVALAKFSKEEQLLPTLGALCSGGLPLVCVCPTAAVTKKGLTLAVNTFPDTVIGIRATSADHAELACKCGVSFVCSPFFEKSIYDICSQNDISYIPGALTPSEVSSLLSLGLRTVILSPSRMIPDEAISYCASLFPGVNFLIDCSDDPDRAVKAAALPGVIGALSPDIISSSLDKTVANCIDLVGKLGNKQ